MSIISASQSDFDFWEFVCCGRCQLPLTSTAGATVPFWLTECGHIVCNNHLNADQSCSHCRAPGIQVVPLQSEMEEPMSGWFRSMPVWLDGAANAIKFQQETMASQIRHYRSRHQQQRVFIQQLKKANEALNAENNQLRQELGHGQYSDQRYDGQMPTDVPNSNGKRPLMDAQSFRRSEGRPTTTSSPRSVVTPLGPNRLTLPQGQQVPNLSSNRFDTAQGSSSHTSGPGPGPVPDTSQAQQRSVGGFIEKYAYVPPSTPQFHPQRLTHTQAAPQTFKRSKPNEEPQQMRPQQAHNGQGHRNMPPPPTPVRFKPAGIPNSNATQHVRPSQLQAPPQGQGNTGQRQQRSMGPPPTPQMRQQQPRSFQALQPINSTASSSSRHLGGDSLPPTNRFQPPTQHFVPPPSAQQGQHSGLATLSTGNAPQRFIPSGSRAPSRAQPAEFSGGAQRMPFVSNGQGRDGYR